MSPEMLSGKSYDPLTSDIWSCGVILYGMVAGNMPFDEWTDAGIFQKITNGDYEKLKRTSKDFQNLISRIFDTNHKTRITIPEIQEHALMCRSEKEVAVCIEEL